jgi:hypothetical protein
MYKWPTDSTPRSDDDDDDNNNEDSQRNPDHFHYNLP